MHGKKVKLKDVDDTHLVNLLHYSERGWHEDLQKVLKRIAKKRNLSETQLSRTRIPYMHNKKWQYWNEEANCLAFCAISSGKLSADHDELIEALKARLLGYEPRRVHYVCVDCNIPYPIINGKVMCNGKQIKLCPWCRKDSKPNKDGRGV